MKMYQVSNLYQDVTSLGSQNDTTWNKSAHLFCIEIAKHLAGNTENMGLFRSDPVMRSVPVNLRTVLERVCQGRVC